MAPIRIEFTIEPFVDGQPGPHVLAAIAAVEGRGVAVDVGPFSTIAEVPADAAASMVADLLQEALDHGATGITLRVDRAHEDQA
jgi:uncharacterized protein YqgV (UPF0045/DUF77 family)